MSRKFARNSKKGLTLPMAIVISIVLVIIAAGLIFIALSSISTTDVSVSGRQAFINVRSALEYAESYYRTQVSNYAKIGTEQKDTTTGQKWREEYIIAEETEVPVTATQNHVSVKYTVQNDEPNTNVTKTYVTARYFPAKGKVPPQLKLTGYSHYSDTFGNNGKSVSMSVMFTVGSSNAYKRVTVINTFKDPNTQSTGDVITLHMKTPSDLPWSAICYYVWTYNDVANAYHDDDGKNIKYSYYDKNGNKITPDVDKMNINEKTDSVKPNSYWETNTAAPIYGPTGMMVTQGNGWAVGDYQINSKRVNYFNVIFANRNTLLDPDGIFDSQMNEIFHLWYLNENDKNIYFEFFNSKKYDSTANLYYYTRYRTGGNWSTKGKVSVANSDLKDSWNGLDGLDDTILVYLRNQKTTVHFRSYNDSNTMAAPAAGSEPVIESVVMSDGSAFTGPTYITNSGRNQECSGSKKTTDIKMTYEGCGWWVASIETKKTFNITIKYAKDMTAAVTLNNVRPHTDSSAPEAVPESWIVLKSNGKLEAHQTEKTALGAIGVASDSYVTIHAKNYDPDIPASPVLNYMNVIAESSTGRQRLYEAILSMGMLTASDYSNYEALFGDKTDDEGNVVLGLKNKAIGVYNAGVKFMKKPYKVDDPVVSPADDDVVDMDAAEEAYMSYVNRINVKITELLPAYADAETVNKFVETYEEAQIIYENLVDYDSGYHDNFTTEFKKTFTGTTYTNYEQLYALVQNQANITISKKELGDINTGFSSAVTTIKEQKLNRTNLEKLIKEIDDNENYKDKKIYQELYVDKLVDALKTPRKLIEKDDKTNKYKEKTTASVLSSQYTALNDAFEELKKMPVPKDPEIDFTALDEKLLEASALVTSTKANGRDYTDATMSVLEQVITQVQEFKTQEGVTAEKVVSETARLQQAMNRLTVYKPENIADNVGQNLVRVWLENKDGCTFTVSVKGTTGGFVTLTNDRIKYEGGTGLSYVDFAKESELYFNINASLNGSAEMLASPDIEVSKVGENVVFGLDDKNESLVEKELVTVFLSQRDADQNNITISDFIATNGKTTGKGTEANYVYIRFAVEKGKSFSETLAVTQTDTKTNTTSTAGLTGENIITTPGEHIIIWTDDGDIKKYKRISVSDVYPKTTTAAEPPTEPATGGTVAPADEEYEIVPVSTDLNWAAVFEDINKSDSIGDGKICILFDTNGNSAFNSSNKPHIYTWRGAGITDADRNASYKNKPQMAQYGNTAYYYYICDSKFTHFIISNYSGDDGGDHVKVMDSTALDGGYKYYVYRAGSKNYVWESDSAGESKIGGKDITEVIDIAVPSGQLCIFFDTQGSVDQPYIHYWGGTDHTTWGTLTAMTKFHDYNNYYYVLISDSNKGFLIARDSAGGSKVVTGDGKLEEKTSSGRYSYYIVRAKSDGKSYNVTPYETTPSVVVEEPEEVKDMISGLPMAYVGGGRIRVKNKSYVDTYGAGQKKNSMQTLMVVYKDGDYTGYGTDSPRIHLWNDEGLSTKGEDRPTMSYLGQSGARYYFYYIFDKSYTKFKLTNGDGSYETNEISLSGKEAYLVNGVGGHIDQSGGSLSSLPSGLSLSKLTLDSNWLFGGYGANNASSDRVGDSKLLPYYDWYEYKIPVEQSNVYTFEVWGLDPNDTSKNNKTPQIKKVYGDVWVNLYNDDGTTGSGTALDGVTKTIKTFKYTELSTFDPEKIMTSEKINVYFRMPVYPDDPTHKWQNLKISQAHGTGAKAYGDSSVDIPAIQQDIEMKELKGGRVAGEDGYGRNTNIWKSGEISKNNPFIEFSVDEVINGTVFPHTYKVRYQGGLSVLFDPTKNSGYGAWVKYQSDSDRLEEVCGSLVNMYYAKTIVDQYNSNGEMVTQSSDSVHYSSYLRGLITGTYSSYFVKAGGSNGTYKASINASNIESSDAEADKAYRDCQDISDIIDDYNALYIRMGEAKAYMDRTLGTDYHGNAYHRNSSGASQYPEYVNRGNFRTYNSEDVNALAGKLSKAEVAFITGKWTDSDGNEETGEKAAERAVEALDRTIANIRVGVEGTIAVVLYDAQSHVGNGYSYTISYKDSTGKEHENEPVDQVNIEGYPIKFIYNELTDTPYEYIESVQFKNTYTDKDTGIKHENVELGTPCEKIEKNEVYVFMDYGKIDGDDASFWRKNDLTDYREMNSDEYIQEKGSEDVELKMKQITGSTEYEAMTVYFKYDTTVKYFKTVDGTEKQESYKVKAGAYDFEDADTTDTTSPVVGGVLRLFSPQAEAYFTNPENYGVYTSGQDASTLGWRKDGDFSTINMTTTNGDVNMDASTGSFTRLPGMRSYSYSSNKGIYFRWSSESNLEVGGGGVEFHASEIKFGAVGIIDASTEYNSSGNAHFKFYNYSGETSMIVHFLTDITVQYSDSTGIVHSFVIREGKYIIEKDPESTETYIADLFNETYWKTGVYARPISDGTDITKLGGGTSGLGDKLTYGN